MEEWIDCSRSNRNLRTSIQVNPVTRNLFERVAEQTELHWLLHEAVAAKLISRGQILRFARGGPYDDRNRPDQRVSAYATEDFQPVELRQLQIEKNQGQMRCVSSFLPADQAIECFLSIPCNDEFIFGKLLLQRDPNKHLVVVVVFDHENAR